MSINLNFPMMSCLAVIILSTYMFLDLHTAVAREEFFASADGSYTVPYTESNAWSQVSCSMHCLNEWQCAAFSFAPPVCTLYAPACSMIFRSAPVFVTNEESLQSLPYLLDQGKHIESHGICYSPLEFITFLK